MDEPLWKLDAWRIADLVRGGDVSAKEVLETSVERIEAYNPELNAFCHLDLEGARAQAAEIDRRIASGEDAGPLAGVPIGVKELEDVRGMPSTKGSLLFADVVADRDSVQVSRLRRAGCVVVGKTTAPEFGIPCYTSTKIHGTTRNPWNLERTPGGSSGGSAAAVAAAIVPIATGSDGGGSIRIPASYSGLFGPKGTYGRIPMGGADASHTSVYGPMARGVRDAARYYDCVVGSHELDQFSLPHPGFRYEERLDEAPAGMRAVWSDDLGFGACGEEVKRIAKKAADEVGAILALRWSDRRVQLKEVGAAWGVLGAAMTWWRVNPFLPERWDDLSLEAMVSVRTAEQRVNAEGIARAHERRYENNAILSELFEDVDLIVTPTTPCVGFQAEGPLPLEIDGRRMRLPVHIATFTYPFNMSGHPGFSIPCGFDSDGMPVGLQLVTRRHDDHVLFALAAAVERARPWPKIATSYV